MRKRRPGEVVCLCGAYRFPHRELGGACNGGAYVEAYFEDHMHSDCRDCPHYERDDEGQLRCQVLEGRDRIINCPALDEHIRFEGIKLYGVNA